MLTIDFGRAEWFVVEPEIVINSKVISPRALIVQTLIGKCMGPIHEWESLIKAQTDLSKRFIYSALSNVQIDYNAFHFTPLQVFGGSDSSYAIADQLGFDSQIFPNMTAVTSITSELSVLTPFAIG